MSSIQNFFTSRDNNANASTYVGQLDRLWYDPVTNKIYVSDGSTPGGIPVAGGGSGNGTPGGANTQIQFNDAGTFGATANLTYNKATNQLTLNGNLTALDATVYGTVAAVTGVFSGNVTADNTASANVVSSRNGLFLDANVIPESYTLPAGFNAMSAGPIEIVDGANVTVPDGQRWTIV
jgi:hypothetical protein